ncbi:hypothetical protein [Chondromyces crocatus]|uniref:Uncharacterized protein n=1 Tax=Chondromyces crocatus TaxID=52 RepID=A0A0K1EK40_CHOCO|nr:hypothetical protein [Chondromyces crocatus]AKT41042.1 uncharacterized protein CMC5_052000 [Chondromyces crocatus]
MVTGLLRGRPGLLPRGLAVGVLGVGLLLGQGCELIVDGEVGTIGCSEEGVIGAPACPAEHVCRAGSCVALAPLGRPCFEEGDCAPGSFCLAPGAGSGDVQVGFCSRPCCASSDCDPAEGLVCWVPKGSAFGFCRSGPAIGRERVGRGKAGAPCSGAGDCRSGLCSGGSCVDTCCSDANCAAGGGVCQLAHGLVAAGAAWTCLPPRAGTRGTHASCSGDEVCASGACLDIEGTKRCAAPCCGSAQCPGVVDGGAGELLAARCRVVDHGGAPIRACVGSAEASATLGVGAACRRDDQCRSGVCVLPAVERPPESGGGGICGDMCCADQACGDPSNVACRPEPARPSLDLRCEPK